MLAKLRLWLAGGEIDWSYGTNPYDAEAIRAMKSNLRQTWISSALLGIVVISTGRWWYADPYWAGFIILYVFLFLVLTQIEEPATYIWHACLHAYLIVHNLTGQLGSMPIPARILWLGIAGFQGYCLFTLCRAFKYSQELYYAKKHVSTEWLLARRLQWGWLVGIVTTLVAIGLVFLPITSIAPPFSTIAFVLPLYLSAVGSAFSISSLKTPDGPRLWGWVASIFSVLFLVSLHGLLLLAALL